MTKGVKKTSSRDETEIMEVQESTRAETSSDQTKKRGRPAKLTTAEKGKRKKASDKTRYHKNKEMLGQIGVMQVQLEILKNQKAELGSQMGEVNSKLLPAITQDMKKMKGDLELVQNAYKRVETLLAKSLLKENDIQIPMDELYFEKQFGENNMNVGNHNADLPTGEASQNIFSMTDAEFADNDFDLFGMSEKERAEFDKTKKRVGELETEIEILRKGHEELKREIKELKEENERR